MNIVCDAVRRTDLRDFARWFGVTGLLALVIPGRAYPLTEEDEESWYESIRAQRREGRGYVFAIRPEPDAPAVGTASLSVGQGQRTGALGLVVADPAARRKGFGRQACEFILRYGFDELDLNRVELWVFDYNTPAEALYQSVGFKEEGRRRQSLFRDGAFHDEILMGMLSSEYRWQHRGASAGWIPRELSRRLGVGGRDQTGGEGLESRDDGPLATL